MNLNNGEVITVNVKISENRQVFNFKDVPVGQCFVYNSKVMLKVYDSVSELNNDENSFSFNDNELLHVNPNASVFGVHSELKVSYLMEVVGND